MSEIEMKRGMSLSFMPYYGTDKILAESLYDHLVKVWRSQSPLHITGTALNMKATEVTLFDPSKARTDHGDKYMLIVRGELL